MKKFVSIVIALVMVLSMTSAFALNNCFSGFGWACEAEVNYCGRGTVEIVPFVKANIACAPYWEFVQSDCAAAVGSTEVYYAIKLNVEANADHSGNHTQQAYWWDEADIAVEFEGINAADSVIDLATQDAGIDWTADEAESYYWVPAAGNWVNVEDADLDDVVSTVAVTNPHTAEVCATLTSEWNGYGVWFYGDYRVAVDNANDSITITTAAGDSFFMGWVDGEVNTITASSDAFMKEVQAAFNLAGCVIGTCVNDANIKANFGWDTEQEDCFGWDDTTPSIVNPECSVEIPKTGDVSVVAYAVMAIAAAAGMLKK